MRKEKRKRFTAVLLLISILATCFQVDGLTANAASSVTVSISNTYHLYHNKWTANGGYETVNSSVKAKLHYIDGAYGYCAYMQDSSKEGEVKVMNPDKDDRTDWLNKTKNGYTRAAYCAIVDAYLVGKTITLDGISDSSSLMSLTATERKFLSQAFVWYMQFAGYNRTAGTYAMAIKGISGWGVQKQYKLFDELFESAKAKLSTVDANVTCYKNSSGGNDHQPIALFTCTVKAPSYASVTRTAQRSASQEITFKINRKTDLVTGAGLSGAEFTFQCEGTTIGKGTTDANGILDYVYRRTLTTQSYSSTKYYVTNWNDLSASVRAAESAKGYYSDPTTAGNVAQNEVNQKADAELESLKSKSYKWKIVESKAPFGHLQAEAQEVLETSDKKSFETSFIDIPNYIDLDIIKKSSHEDMGVEATLQDATYGLYAKENILDTDNKTVLFAPNELVATMTTDQEGKASIKGLHPGYYYLKEINAPRGFTVDTTSHNLDLTELDQEVTLTDQLIRGRIRILKTYGVGEPEKDAVFEVYNSKDQLVQTLTTDANGTAVTNYLPYGSYTIRQTEGKEGYALMPEQTILIETAKIYELQENDEELYAGIAITKTTYLNDPETGYMEKRPEVGAQFTIKRNGQLIETITVNGNGLAKSGKLEPGYTYHVEQTKGTMNFKNIEPFDVTFGPGEYVIKSYPFEDKYEGKKIRVEKKMKNGSKESPEPNARFAVLDASIATNINSADLSTAQKRADYCNGLPEGGFLTTMTTDENGKAAALLLNLPQGHDFIVLQIDGESGYTLADPYFSADHQSEVINEIPTYTMKATDIFDEWGKISIKKTMVTGRTNSTLETLPESDAKFEILDSRGTVVQTLTTDTNGEAVSGQLKYGAYVLHQISGKSTHQMIKDFRFVINQDTKHQTTEYSFQDEEKPVTFELTKRSARTDIPLNGATYEIYNEGGNRVATVTTGLKSTGVATCELPYGKYTAKEIKGPDGYKLSDPFTFTISSKNVEYENGSAVYKKTDYDEPVYGEIILNKSGEVLSGAINGQFEYEDAKIPGATYGLFAREDIKNDDGSVLYTAGQKISEATTDANGYIRFSRTAADMGGQTTTLFPMGKYYIKELSSPYGYVLDTEEHEIVLSWDRKAEDLNKDPEKTPEGVEEQEEAQKPAASTGKYVLNYKESGVYSWNNASSSDSIVFTNITAPSGATKLDVSADGDNSVVCWYASNTYYISTQTEGQDVIFNARSEGLFKNCQAKAIYFDCVDTSQTVVFSQMFMGCTNLTSLDLSNFNTANAVFVDEMFADCTNLETIYAPGFELTTSPESLTIQSVVAKPKYEFLVGSTYQASDFTFYAKMSDGSEQQISIANNQATISPAKATAVGKATVSFTFSSASGYSAYSGTTTEVTVVDVTELTEDPPKDFKKTVDVTDELKTHRIRFNKVDNNGNPVEGAEFTLYAACTIVNSKGTVLYQTGDKITTALSELNGETAEVNFRGLPSDLYKQTPQSSGAMFTVKETKPAPGYQLSTTTMSFSMNIASNMGNAGTILHTSPSGQATTVQGNVATVYDAQNIVNNPSDYVTITKTWDDSTNPSLRPDSVTVLVTFSDNSTKTYTITKENNWQCITDILASDYGTIDHIDETSVDDINYTSISVPHDDVSAWEIINKLKVKYKELSVEKVWDDEDNKDGFRPSSITVDLYQNSTVIQTVTLNAANSWKRTFTGLEIADENGVPYDYEFKERAFDKLTGDVNTGYRAGYNVIPATAETPVEQTIITNRHVPETTSFEVQKVWKDANNEDGTRPESIQVTLSNNVGSASQTVTLNEANGWKDSISNLPVYKDGQKITYTWTETNWTNPVSGGRGITGDKTTGYEVSYTNRTADASNPCVITNEHTPRRGKVTLQKRIDSSAIDWDAWTPKFMFHISGTTDQGETYQSSKEVVFTKEEVETLKATQGTTVWKEIVFDDLEKGTYTITETGTEGYYELSSITSDSDGIIIRDVNDVVTKNTTVLPIVTNNTGRKSKDLTVKIGDSSGSDRKTWEASAVVTNTIRKGSLTIHKKDENGTSLSGVTFTLYDTNGTQVATATTDSNGNASFTNLSIKDYVLKETKSKPGYTLLADPVNVTIPVVLTEEEAASADTSKAIRQGSNYYFYDISYEIDNTVTLAMPATGNNIKYGLILLSFVLLLGVAYGMYRKKK